MDPIAILPHHTGAHAVAGAGGAGAEAPASKPATKLLTSKDLAEIAQCDLKSIHIWVEKGQIPAVCWFRTPGRHLRFYPGPTFEWAARQGYMVPGQIRAACGALPSPAAPFIAQAIIDCGELRGGGVSQARIEALYTLLRRAAEVDASVGRAYEELTEAREQRRAAAEKGSPRG